MKNYTFWSVEYKIGLGKFNYSKNAIKVKNVGYASNLYFGIYWINQSGNIGGNRYQKWECGSPVLNHIVVSYSLINMSAYWTYHTVRVVISTMWIIHRWNIDFTPMNEPILTIYQIRPRKRITIFLTYIRNHNTSYRHHNNGVATLFVVVRK